MDARDRKINEQKGQKKRRIPRGVVPENPVIQRDFEDGFQGEAAAKAPPVRKNRRKKKRPPSIHRFYPLLLFLVTGVLHGVVASQMTVPIIVPDELNTLGISAFLTGCDWSSLMSSYANYYGYGQALLVAPLFLFIRDNILLYKGILVLYGVLMALIPVIAWHLMTGVFRRPRNFESFLWALTIGLFPCYTIYSKFAWNESLIMLLPWISLGWILHCIGEGRRAKEWVMAFLMVLGYATHGRYLGVVVSLLIMIWICQKFCRVQLLRWKKFILWMGVFLAADALIKWALLQRLWRLMGPGTVRNTLSETLARNALLLLTLEGWQNLFRGLNGFTFDVVVVSFGLLFASTALFVYKHRIYSLGLFHSVIRKCHKYGVELFFDENWKKPEEEVVYAVEKETIEEPSPKSQGKEAFQVQKRIEEDSLEPAKAPSEKEEKENDSAALEKQKDQSFLRKFYGRKDAASEAMILETIDMDSAYGSDKEPEGDKERRQKKEERRQALLESTWLPVDKVHLILPKDFMKEEACDFFGTEEGEHKFSDPGVLGSEGMVAEGASVTINKNGKEGDFVSPEKRDNITPEVVSQDFQGDTVVVDLGENSEKRSFLEEDFLEEDLPGREMRRRRRLLMAEFFLGGFSLLSIVFAIAIGSIFFLADFGKTDSEYYIIFGRYTEYLLAFHLLYLIVALGKKALPSKVVLWGFLLTVINFLLTYFLEGKRIGLKNLAGINVYLLLSYTPKFQLKSGEDLMILMALALGVAVLCLSMLRLNFKKISSLLLLAVFLFSYGHTSQKEFLAMAKTQYGYVDATYELLYGLDGIYKEYPDIYLYNIKSPQIYQLPLRDFRLHRLNKEEPEIAPDLKDNCFLISEGDWPAKGSEDFYQIWLPKTDATYNRGLWVHGEILHKQLLEKGVKFVAEYQE